MSWRGQSQFGLAACNGGPDGNKLRISAEPSIGETFDPAWNALNSLRLYLALLVIASHSIVLGGYRSETLWDTARSVTSRWIRSLPSPDSSSPHPLRGTVSLV